MEQQLHIGTSGWHYKHWVGTFYPKDVRQKDFTGYYTRFFRTVEINNSFYKLPTPDTFASWRNAVPDDFIFSVKASRYLTHMKKLLDPQEPLSRFFHSANALEHKLGPVLFQLPPGWKVMPPASGIFWPSCLPTTGILLSSVTRAGTRMKFWTSSENIMPLSVFMSWTAM